MVGCRGSVACNHHRFATFDDVPQTGELGLCFVDIYLSDAPDSSRTSAKAMGHATGWPRYAPWSFDTRVRLGCLILSAVVVGSVRGGWD